MKCEKCDKNATVFYKETVNGKTTSTALCAECAAKAQSEAGFSAHFPFGTDLFGNLFGISAPTGVPASKKCDGCGASFADVRRAGKVGCAKCYEIFSTALAPTIHSLYGKAENGLLFILDGIQHQSRRARF